jgi:hypothetical protein
MMRNLYKSCIPGKSTRQTLRPVHAQQAAALGTSPLLLFLCEVAVNADIFDACQIFDRARAVFGPVALVQPGEVEAGEFCAVGAILNHAAEPLFTGLYFANDSRLRLRAILNEAARADVLRAQVPDAHCAVDPAWSNHYWIKRINLHYHTLPSGMAF